MTTQHLQLTKADLRGSTLAIVPGDPARVARIAAHLQDPVHLQSCREFTSYRATLDGHVVMICSTGIGGPSTSIAIEELAQLGIRTFLRVGTTGSIQPHVPNGSLVITQASVRLDGASRHFAPLAFPAASSFECTWALKQAAVQLGLDHAVGITASSDTFYPGQERYDTVAGQVLPEFRGSMKEWQRLGVLNFEMESATLLTMCAVNGWKAGCVSGVIAHRVESEIFDPAMVAPTEEKARKVVVEAARILLRKQQSASPPSAS